MKRHLTDEELAALVEGQDLGEAARDHVESCPLCFEIYGQGVELLLSRNEVGNSRRERSRRPIPILAAAAILVVAAGVFWTLRQAPSHPGLPPEARVLVAAYSAEALVIPGAEDAVGDAVPVYRNGGTGLPADVLVRLRAAYDAAGAEAREAADLIATLVAAGKVDDAEVILADARRRFGEEEPFLVLEGIAAYRRNDLDRARSLFLEALESDAEDEVAEFNLGRVEMELGLDVGRDRLTALGERLPATPLRARAAREAARAAP